MSDWLKYLTILLGGCGFLALGWFLHAPKPCDEISTAPIVIHDTTEGKIRYKNVPIPREITIMQMDSLYEDAKNWWIARMPKDTVYKDRPLTFGLFTATKDTTYQDSLLQSHSEIRSRFPIDPKLKWLQDFTIKKTTITKEVEKPRGFFSRFQPVIYTGVGIDPIRSQFGISIGVAFAFEL
jgi:hypothetical protein